MTAHYITNSFVCERAVSVCARYNGNNTENEQCGFPYTQCPFVFNTHTQIHSISYSLWLFRAFSQKGKNSLNIIKWKTEKETHHFDMVDVMNSSREYITLEREAPNEKPSQKCKGKR